MGGHGSRAFLGRVHEDEPDGSVKTRPVVFVFLPPEVEEQPEVMAQIVEETRVASRIDHPNVIGVWGVTRLDEGMARIVDFANGESIRAVLRRVREENLTIPPKIAAAIAADACMGVHYAHELGIAESGSPMVHGGVRPETLLVTFEGRGMVTGYGASTLAEWFRRGQGVDGSIRDPYTAPEQAFGGRAAATVPTDVYALGTVLWELLTLESPPGHYRPQDTAAFERELIDDKLLHAGAMLPGIVMKALRAMAPSRYATPLDMRHALLDAGVAPADDVRAFMERLFPSGSLGRAARDDLISSPLEPNALTSTAEEIEIPDWAPEPTIHESGEFSTLAQGSAPEAALPTMPALDDMSDPQIVREDTPRPTTAPRMPVPTEEQIAAATHPITAPFTHQPAPSPGPVPAAAPPPALVQAPPPASKFPVNAVLLLLVGLLGGALVVVLILRGGKDDGGQQIEEVVDKSKSAKAKQKEEELEKKLAAALAEKEAAEKVLAEQEAKKKAEETKKEEAKKAAKRSRRRRSRSRASESGAATYATSDYATLYVEAPDGTTILVDGRKKGVTPMGPVKLSVGRHTVHAKKGGGNVRKTFSIGAGQEVTFTANFRVVE